MKVKRNLSISESTLAAALKRAGLLGMDFSEYVSSLVRADLGQFTSGELLEKRTVDALERQAIELNGQIIAKDNEMKRLHETIRLLARPVFPSKAPKGRRDSGKDRAAALNFGPRRPRRGTTAAR